VKPVGRLHTLTDTVFQSRFDHVRLAEIMIAGGAHVVQLREKRDSTRAMIAAAVSVARMCRPAGVTFIINDRVDVALASDADGVHLGQDDFPVTPARRLLGPDRIIGVSVDSIEEALRAWREGADYVGFGPVFPTGSKQDTGPVAGVESLRDVVSRVPLPVIAIGGVHLGNIESVLRAGAHGAAVLSAVAGSEDPLAATGRLREIIDKVCGP